MVGSSCPACEKSPAVIAKLPWHIEAGAFDGTLTMHGFAFPCLLPPFWSFVLWPPPVASPVDALDSAGPIGLVLGGGERDLSAELHPAFGLLVGAEGNCGTFE